MRWRGPFKTQGRSGAARTTGAAAERAAENYLLEQGLTLLERNFLCRQGEIDLIMQQRDMLVFVEVRFRKSAGHGSALESVTAAKQRKIVLAAQYYLMQKRGGREAPMRFDVLGIMPLAGGFHHDWIQNAFGGA